MSRQESSPPPPRHRDDSSTSTSSRRHLHDRDRSLSPHSRRAQIKREEQRPREADNNSRRAPAIKREQEGDDGRQRPRDGSSGAARRGGGDRNQWGRAPGRGGDDPFADVPESQRFGIPGGDEDAPPPIEKEQPNYNVSGALAAEQNTFKGVVLKYSEPAEARKPKERYRLYVFKGKELLDMLHIHRQSAFLIGRERLVADIPIDHPSCSKQHAAIQYRQIVETDGLGAATRVIKPYLIDLDSANGTTINGNKVPPSRYVELKVGDTIVFGFSTREYVLMSEEQVG